ncbi:iron-containing alcohol dehydrogenase family protein [Cytobacillus purgationiresistens]|uniref:Alcohol dehydrogenase class IV n=1 Tax=Cytobacillus purgationiresistens TaxID=863449 RepID=A0ABU0AKS0_9BACI|nr:iron-containing alcohol dehydrogenase family protein [Cytobacillus purgationiresistens]MDQ0271861.1 alcohol dehydrogenase class IV [Cytobacillus purgationiresistens]
MSLINTPFSLKLDTDLKFGFQIVQQELANSIKKAGKKKAFIITDKGLIDSGVVENVTSSLDEAGIDYAVFSDVLPNPPANSVMTGVESFKHEQADMIVALGGGSAMDYAKALAVAATHPGFVLSYSLGGKPIEDILPLLFAIPTTIGTGSEVTIASVITDTDAGRKLVLASPYLIPKSVFVDPSLTLGLPRQHVAATGSDAFVHAVESYVSLPANPFTDALALQAIRMIWDNLPQTYGHDGNLEARAQVHLASTFAGMSFSLGGLGLVHSLSHPMSARYNVPHGLANAILLPHIIEHNLSATPQRYADIARMLDPELHFESVNQAAKALIPLVQEFLQSIDIPDSFGYLDRGFSEEQIEQLAEDAMNDHGTVHNNPKKAVKEDIVKIYQKVLPAMKTAKVYN